MSDTPQGTGWWQASDDRWYPPQPDPRPPPPSPPSQWPVAGIPQPPVGPPDYHFVSTHRPAAPASAASRVVLWIVLAVIGFIVLLGMIVFASGNRSTRDGTVGVTRVDAAYSMVTRQVPE